MITGVPRYRTPGYAYWTEASFDIALRDDVGIRCTSRFSPSLDLCEYIWPYSFVPVIDFVFILL